MLIQRKINNWCGEIKICVEDRYLDSGEILMIFDDSLESYTASLTLNDLIKFRDNINEIIEELKTV